MTTEVDRVRAARLVGWLAAAGRLHRAHCGRHMAKWDTLSHEDALGGVACVAWCACLSNQRYRDSGLEVYCWLLLQSG